MCYLMLGYMKMLSICNGACSKFSLSVKIIFLIISPVLFNISCQSGEQKRHSNSEQHIDSNEGQSELYSYWDGYNFNDTLLILDSDVVEQKLVDFIHMFSKEENTAVKAALFNMLNKASLNKKVFDYFLIQYEHYLYDPNSPFHNDVYYLPVVEYVIESEMTEAWEKEKYSSIYRTLSKNMPGELSNDFTFINVFGAAQTFHNIDSPYKLLIFYDPDCEHCDMILKDIQRSSVIQKKIDDNKAKVVTIFPWNDYVRWKDYQLHIPIKWLNGFDRYSSILHDEIYELRAFPTIYLIDESNRVVLKDITLQQVERFFMHL